MDNFMTANFGNIAIVFVCAVVFIGALVSVTYKDEIKKIKNDDYLDADINEDWIADKMQKDNYFYFQNPINKDLPGNIYYNHPKL